MHRGKPYQRNGLIHAEVAEIVLMYDIELRGYYNYYQLAGNVGKQLAQLRYVMWQSLTRTLARKLRCRTRVKATLSPFQLPRTSTLPAALRITGPSSGRTKVRVSEAEPRVEETSSALEALITTPLRTVTTSPPSPR